MAAMTHQDGSWLPDSPGASGVLQPRQTQALLYLCSLFDWRERSFLAPDRITFAKPMPTPVNYRVIR
jgi:hypothetical protein